MNEVSSAIRVTLSHSVKYAKQGVGVVMTVAAHPSVEELFKGLTPDEPMDVINYGRNWIPLEGHPLNVYMMPGVLTGPQGGYRLDRPGFNLNVGDPYEDPSYMMNLSFLRLVGISQGTGVRLGLQGTYNMTSLRDLQQRLSVACRAFYVDHMKPVDLIVGVYTQEYVPTAS